MQSYTKPKGYSQPAKKKKKNIVRSNLVCFEAFLGEFGRACSRLCSVLPAWCHAIDTSTFAIHVVRLFVRWKNDDIADLRRNTVDWKMEQLPIQ